MSGKKPTNDIVDDDDNIYNDDNIDDEETRRGVENPTGTEFEAVWLGPIPWLTTALAIAVVGFSLGKLFGIRIRGKRLHQLETRR